MPLTNQRQLVDAREVRAGSPHRGGAARWRGPSPGPRRRLGAEPCCHRLVPTRCAGRQPGRGPLSTQSSTDQAVVVPEPDPSAQLEADRVRLVVLEEDPPGPADAARRRGARPDELVDVDRRVDSARRGLPDGRCRSRPSRPPLTLFGALNTLPRPALGGLRRRARRQRRAPLVSPDPRREGAALKRRARAWNPVRGYCNRARLELPADRSSEGDGGDDRHGALASHRRIPDVVARARSRCRAGPTAPAAARTGPASSVCAVTNAARAAPAGHGQAAPSHPAGAVVVNFFLTGTRCCLGGRPQPQRRRRRAAQAERGDHPQPALRQHAPEADVWR